MIVLKELVESYLDYCQYQKKLNSKTIKAYSIDLRQFTDFMATTDGKIDKSNISLYIIHVHKNNKPKTIKRKFACLKAFFNYLEYEEILNKNPFDKIKVKFKEPLLLPRTIPINIIQQILTVAYISVNNNTPAKFQNRSIYRDIAVLELLFATGVRVSELCSLSDTNVDLITKSIRVNGKGSKERIIQIGNEDVLSALNKYQSLFSKDIQQCKYFFVNRLKGRLSEQSVRYMINKYVNEAKVTMHITPHMFRHSFATLLLEEDVDIRYIQQLLGHSSITTTQIYTHVTSNKQKYILTTKHPRNKLVIDKG
ncbi:tyrosine-type recombinase/integrase [Desulfosporosinus fructosivorans]